ncbi:MAG: lytic transglycosylase domain-containing protein, partial [Cytophagaceae bacterium]|nr:lytic transglycosylase domain-containing protein [Cytophagaceae bacterium]
MKKFILFFFFAAIAGTAFTVEVPEEIHFAGMDLKLTDEVRRKLKSDIELITKSQKGFQIKLERANLYFPIIEKIFKEENLPDDFKFLSLQESALVSDVVSSSNAVGYWQFKKETAIEVGLRVDYYVDERINIVSSSRGAAKYLKKNNGALDNWIYALLSYNVGLGGVKSMVKDKYIGAKKMVIDKDMHWYVIRFLAHKLAYQDAVGKDIYPTQMLVIHDNCQNKSMVEISNETEVAIEKLYMYNKWLLRGNVPDDKTYAVILPVTPAEKERLVAKNVIHKNETKYIAKKEEHVLKPDKKKRDSDLTGTSDVAMLTFVNKIKVIKAKSGDNAATLAIQGGITVNDFLRYNDLK